MVTYTVRRVLLGGVPTLLAVATLTFVLMHAVPDGPWDREKPLAPTTVENLNRVYHLDESLPVQYGHFLWNLSRGDLGVSFARRDREVRDLIERGAGASALLAGAALLIAVPLALVPGVAAARRPGSPWDMLAYGLGIVGAAVPAFVIAIALVLLFTVELQVLPAGCWGGVRHIVLPAMALAILPLAYLTRVIRTTVADTARAAYVRTASAKGLHPATVLRRHIAPNAIAAPLVVFAPLLADLLAGSFIVESIFGVPGVGRLLVQSVFDRDHGLIMGVTLFYAAVIIVANIAVDLVQAALDPRIRLRLVA